MNIRHPEILKVKRVVNNRGIRKLIYYFPSLINKRMIPCDSGLEWELAHLFELDRFSIQAYDSQPHKLVYYDGTKRLSYTPDFLVNQAGKEWVVEVKPAEKVPDHIKKLQAVEAAYEMLGLRFVVLTDAYIRKKPRLDNAKLILRHARHPVTRTSLKAVLDHFKNRRGPHTLSSVLEQLAPCEVEQGEIIKLIYCGIIGFDPEEPLSGDPVVWLSNDVNA